MDSTKDYYAILGVLPTAEDVVIRAAYKALAQRYHPDRNPDTIAEATRRMAEINEAYTVLSDAAKRRAYDESRPSKNQAEEADLGGDSDSSTGDDALGADWKLATKYHPELVELFDHLGKISRRLAFTFRVFLLETKNFKNSRDYAATLERTFLEQYFGKNGAIIAFATKLILNGERKAALELNNVVRVLGDGLDSGQVIKSISTEFGLFPPAKQYASMDAIRFLAAVRHGQIADVSTALKNHRQLIDIVNSDNETALHIAVSEVNIKMLKTLLQYSPNKYKKDRWDRTPLELAQSKGYTELAELLV